MKSNIRVRKYLEKVMSQERGIFIIVYGYDMKKWPAHIYSLVNALVNAHWIESGNGKTLYGEAIAKRKLKRAA